MMATTALAGSTWRPAQIAGSSALVVMVAVFLSNCITSHEETSTGTWIPQMPPHDRLSPAAAVSLISITTAARTAQPVQHDRLDRSGAAPCAVRPLHLLTSTAPRYHGL